MKIEKMSPKKELMGKFTLQHMVGKLYQVILPFEIINEALEKKSLEKLEKET